MLPSAHETSPYSLPVGTTREWHGVVAVSPCISPGEKHVARAVMDAGYPLIVLFPQGIPPHTPEYKPYGKYFDACARGQLLILSPWEFRTTSEPLTRWQCLLLNDIAAQLAVLRHL